MGLILANFYTRQPVSFSTGLFERNKAGAAAAPPGGQIRGFLAVFRRF
tara:strand:- start:42 stop:185 length:144 start_codon:yes stop_codon:yes gene_type:complete